MNEDQPPPPPELPELNLPHQPKGPFGIVVLWHPFLADQP